MGWSTRRNRLRRIKDHLANVGRPVVTEDGERERLEELVHAARASLKVTERMAALPFAERAAGCSPAGSAERIFGDAAIAARVETGRQELAARRAALAEFQQLHGLGPNGVAREVFRYELAAARTLHERQNGSQCAASMVTPAFVAATVQRLQQFPRDEWDELLEGHDELAAAVMAA